MSKFLAVHCENTELGQTGWEQLWCEKIYDPKMDGMDYMFSWDGEPEFKVSCHVTERELSNRDFSKRDAAIAQIKGWIAGSERQK